MRRDFGLLNAVDRRAVTTFHYFGWFMLQM
jgi:hypothetical protein